MKVVRDTLFLSLASVLSKAIGMVRGFVFAHILGPGGYGVLNGLMLIQNYGQYLHLGTLFSMHRDSAIAIGAQDRGKAKAIFDTTWAFCLATGAFGAVAIISVALLADLSRGMRIALVSMAFLVLLDQIVRYIIAVANVELRFSKSSVIQVLGTLMQVAAGVALAAVYGVAGAVAGTAIGVGAAAVFGWRWAGMDAKARFRKEVFPQLLKVGFSLLWINALYTIITSLDRIIILNSFGTEQLGQYAIALLFVSLIAFVPGAVGRAIGPRIMRAYGEESDDKLNIMLQEPIRLLSLLLPIVAGVGALIAPVVTKSLLPKFTDSVVPTQILLLTYTPYAVRSFSAEILVASDEIGILARLQLVGIGFGVALNFAAIQLGFGITGVAAATGFVYFFFGVSLIISALRVRKFKWRPIGTFVARTLSPTVFVSLVVVGELIILGYLDQAISNIIIAPVAGIIFLITVLPLAYVAWRRFSHLRSLTRDAQNT